MKSNLSRPVLTKFNGNGRRCSSENTRSITKGGYQAMWLPPCIYHIYIYILYILIYIYISHIYIYYIYTHMQATGRYLHINAQKKLSAAADWATTCFTYTKQSLEHGGWRDPIVGFEFEVSLYLGQSPGLLRWFVWWNTSRNRHTLLITNRHQRVSSWNELWEIQWK